MRPPTISYDLLDDLLDDLGEDLEDAAAGGALELDDSLSLLYSLLGLLKTALLCTLPLSCSFSLS